MQVKDNAKVSIDYTLKNDAGEVVDTSEGREPLTFTAGKQELLPALEQALMGKQKGDNIEVTLQPEEGYGIRQEEAVQQVPKSQLVDIPDLQVGMPLQAETPQGLVTVFVADIGEDSVTIDGNHPLAGETLHFNVNVVDVQGGDDAAEEPKIIMPN